jgi:hypothetical protein
MLGCHNDTACMGRCMPHTPKTCAADFKYARVPKRHSLQGTLHSAHAERCAADFKYARVPQRHILHGTLHGAHAETYAADFKYARVPQRHSLHGALTSISARTSLGADIDLHTRAPKAGAKGNETARKGTRTCSFAIDVH